jgi:hypothetical protein
MRGRPRPGPSLGGPVRPRPPLTPTWQARRRRGRRCPGSGIAGGKHNERRCAGGQLPSAQRLSTAAVVIPARTARAAAISPAGPAPITITSKTFSLVTAPSHARYGGRFLIPGSGRARTMAVRLELTAQVRAPPVRFGELLFVAGWRTRSARPRSVGSAHGDSFDPRTQSGDAADWGEGPVGVDSELVDRAGGADFVVEVLPVR